MGNTAIKTGTNKDTLTDKQARFAELVATGEMSDIEAYNATHGNEEGKDPSRQTRREDCSKLKHSPKVAMMIERHRAIIAQKAQADYELTTDALLAELSEILADPDSTKSEKMQAVDRIAKLQGLYSEKTEHTVRLTADEQAREDVAERMFAEVTGGITSEN